MNEAQTSPNILFDGKRHDFDKPWPYSPNIFRVMPQRQDKKVK